MKHTLKFSVSTLYRQDNDFLLNTVLFLLYLIPIAMISWYLWVASYHSELKQKLSEVNERLSSVSRKYRAATKKEAPDKDMEEIFLKKYSDYSVLLSSCNISWAEIVEKLESITPNGIRYQRINIRPDKVIKIKLEGRAIDISMLTDFLRVLYSSESFSNPILKHHKKFNLKDTNSSEVSFGLELVYQTSNEGNKQ